MSESSVYQKLRSHLAYLRLGAAAEALPGALEQAHAEQLSHTAFLERLLDVEVAATEVRRLAGLERFSRLPAPWRLSNYDFDAQPSVDRALVNELGTLRFLEDATNVLLIGPPGVGKTMLAVGLGHAAVAAGYRTYYTPAPLAVPAARPRTDHTIYECPDCGQRLLGEQRCPDCATFARRIGPGGPCPHCGEPVAIADLLQEVVTMPGSS